MPRCEASDGFRCKDAISDSTPSPSCRAVAKSGLKSYEATRTERTPIPCPIHLTQAP